MVVDNDPSTRVAVQALAEAHGSRLVAFAYLLAGDPEEAQDLTQAALLRMLTTDLGGVADHYSYARRTISNLFLDRARRRGRYRAVSALLRPSRFEDVSAVPQVDDRLLLASALNVLRPKERAAIVLRFYADLDDAAIAQHVGCTRSSVRSLVHRALPRLRAELERLERNVHRHGPRAGELRGEKP